MNVTLSQAYQSLFICVIFILAVLVLLCLIRAIKGPTIADRIVAINMIGTLTMMIIGILSAYLDEGYLVDVCLVYAMLSFLAVIVLTKIYNGVYKEKRSEKFRQQKQSLTQAVQKGKKGQLSQVKAKKEAEESQQKDSLLRMELIKEEQSRK